MSDSAATASADDTADRFALLELDTPVPALPPWAVVALAAIAACMTLDALEAIVAPLRVHAESPAKAQVRAAVAARQAWLREHMRAMAQRQAIPVITPPSAPAPMQAPATEVMPTPAPTTAPLRGSYAQIKHGPRAGEWGARIENSAAPAIGERVLVSRRNGATSPKFVTAIVWTGPGVTIVGISDVAPQSVPVAAPVATPTPTLVPAPGMTTAHADLESALGAAAIEASSNAGVTALGDRNSIVGFNSAQGYADAAARAVTQATRDEYIAAARRGGVEIDASTLPALPSQSLPVGVGITHTPTGPSIFDQPRETRTQRARAIEARAEVNALLRDGELIGGLVAASDGGMLQVSWVGGGRTTCGAVRDALTPLGLADVAPSPPSAERCAGRAVESLRARDLDTARLPTRDLPDGVKARWMVGTKLTGATVAAGDAYGTARLIVDLRDDGSLAFDGDSSFADAVRGHYAAATRNETLHSDVMTAWLGGLLKSRFYGIKRGATWYVPGSQAPAVEALSNALQPLWGDHETMACTSERDIKRVCDRGLSAEVAAVTKDLDKAIAEAQDRERDKAITAGEDPELAVRRAQLTNDKAVKLTKDLAKVSARITGFTAMLGGDATATLQPQIAAIQTKIAEYTTAGSARAAMLELYDAPRT